MQYDNIMRLNFYDFQNILESYSRILEDRKKEEDDEAKRQGYDGKNYSPEHIMNQAQKNIPKIPQVNIPKF